MKTVSRRIMSDNIFGDDTKTLAESIMERKTEIEKAFKSAESIAERIQILETMTTVSCFKKSELAEYCLSITRTLLMLVPHNHENHERVFSFGKMALTIHCHKIQCFGLFQSFPSTNKSHNTRTSHGSSLYVACVCYLLGSACYGLKWCDESLRYLDWAEENLSKLDDDDNSRCDRNCVRFLLAATQELWYNVKVNMGKQGEAVVHARNALKFKELMMKEDSIELGNTYVEACDAYVAAKDANEALLLCLKALEIGIKRCGENSNEVALLRVNIAVLYSVVGEHEKATEQNQLWQSVLKNTDKSSDFLNAELKVGAMLIHFGMCEEAIRVMRVVASRIDTEKGGRVTSFVNMANASCMLGEFDDAKEHMRAAEIILEDDDIDPIFVGIQTMNLSVLYEKMNDFETAISLLKRVFEKSESHQKTLTESLEKLEHMKLLAKSSTRLLTLISQVGREKQEIPYMRDVVEKLEKSFGREHIEVGYGRAKLGAVLINSGQEDQAVKLIENAKDIMDVALGPHHLDSLTTRHTLSEIYAKLGRYNEAIKIQVKVVEDLKELEPSKQQFMDKAVTLLNEMKERVEESPTSPSSQSQDGEDLSAEKSECETSGDGVSSGALFLVTENNLF